jgi:penicillin-binding protein 1B
MKQNVQPRIRRKSLWRRIVTPRRIAVLGILSAIGVGVFTYFYVRYSQIIDAKLRGEVIVRTSGIYALPRVLKNGQNVSLNEIRSYLDGLGYVDTARTADETRGRYAINGQTLSVLPGRDAIVDGKQTCPAVDITFSRSGTGIVKIIDRATSQAIGSCKLEPELLTNLSNSELEKRKIVHFEDLPPNLVNAFVAIEDRRFFEHRGIDYRGLARAIWVNVTNRELQQGGSTLTQQLVKNIILTPERTYKRKLQEAFIAIVLETRLTKEEIFQLYCNEVFLGQQGNYSINGVGEAASAYFDKDVMKLTLPECALLAGMVRGPSLYSPYSHADMALQRRNVVLDAMVETGAITAEEAETTKAMPLGVREKRALANANAPYFIDYLQRELGTTFVENDLSRQALRIYSTIDMELQKAAELAVATNLAQLDKHLSSRRPDPVPPGTVQAALVALDANTGEILALVGGRDYAQSQLNRVTDAHRQPGSVFKPIVYAAALDTAYGGAGQPITAITPFLDAPEKFVTAGGETYEPDNHGKHYSNRDVPLRTGLVRSLNVVTVRIAQQIGLARVQRIAEAVGLPKPPPYLATALGTCEATPLEVAEAYTAFARLGVCAKPTGLKQVTNNSGATIFAMPAKRRQALQPPVAYITMDILEDVLDHGTAASARARGFRAVAAGKTGTSRDGWFAGFTPNLVCVVWVGFDDNSQLGLEGARSALPIWTDFMKAAVAMRPELAGDEFPRPAGVIDVEIDPESGELATPACSRHERELFIEGTQPQATCPLHAPGVVVVGDVPVNPPPPEATAPPSPSDRPRRVETEEERRKREKKEEKERKKREKEERKRRDLD